MKHRVKFSSLSYLDSTLNPDHQHPLLSLCSKGLNLGMVSNAGTSEASEGP